MRDYNRAGLLLAALTLAVPALASEGQQQRTAQVFLMDVRTAPRAANLVDNTADTEKALSFRLLDLARDKVGEAMRDSFGSSTLASDAVHDQMERTTLPPYSAIAVPGWMRMPMLSALPAASTFVPGCMAVPYRPSGFLPLDIEARRRTTYQAMSAAACEAGIPVALFDALILRESAYNAGAVSPKSAYGLAQLMPGTAAGLGVDRFDPIQNLRGGARYLRAQLDTFGQVPLALAAYNAGPGRVKGRRIPDIAETRNYVSDVLKKWTQLTGQYRTVAVTPFSGTIPPSTTPSSPVQTASIQQF